MKCVDHHKKTNYILKTSKTFLINLSLIISAFLISFLVIEILFRIYVFGFGGNPLKIKNWAIDGVWDVNRSPVELNYRLGWVPRIGFYSFNEPIHSITVNDYKLRSNFPRKLKKRSGKSVLFSGDSFTFGDGVNDNETFPSYFEFMTKKDVINAGVPAYGIDQMFLRSMDLIKQFPISDLFFCFIPDDINRCNNSTFHKIRKPYFIIDKNDIKLVPISNDDFSKTEKFNITLFHKIGGFSLVINNIMRGFFPEYWIYSVQLSKKEEHTNGKQISTILINSLKNECDKNNINFYVVPLTHERYSNYDKNNLQFVLDAINQDINVINVFDHLEGIRKENPHLFSSYFLKKNYHYSKQGNEYVARFIFNELEKSSL